MEASRGLLAVWMEIPGAMEEEFNDWYNQEHVPERTSVPGFLGARRYESRQGTPKYSALYPLRDLEVLSSDDYMKLRRGGASPWTRRIGRNLLVNIRNEYDLLQHEGEVDSQAAAPFVHQTRFSIAPNAEESTMSWFRDEHVPALAAVDGVREARLYIATVGAPKYLLVCELDDERVREGSGWRDAYEAPSSREKLASLEDTDIILGELILSSP